MGASTALAPSPRATARPSAPPSAWGSTPNSPSSAHRHRQERVTRRPQSEHMIEVKVSERANSESRCRGSISKRAHHAEAGVAAQPPSSPPTQSAAATKQRRARVRKKAWGHRLAPSVPGGGPRTRRSESCSARRHRRTLQQVSLSGDPRPPTHNADSSGWAGLLRTKAKRL